VTRPARFAARRGALSRACAAAACAALLLRAAVAAEAPERILQDLRSFREMGSVLYVAAHPDDENTQLIAYLARGRDYRTAYLSLTRGDGGQNVLGPEFGDALGVIRTQELLAARRVDGGRQFFTRARDFGVSKDYRETLTKWDRQAVLSDIVRVIREFRPDVVITRFPPYPSNTHGHHTASAVLALEAFKLAGDPGAFPEQLAECAPWQPRRILWNGLGQAGAAGAGPGGVTMDIDGTDPVTGLSFSTVAGRSRSMHRTQGFANFSVAAAGSGPRIEHFSVLAGEPATSDIMDGVDTTWARVPGGAGIGPKADLVIARFDPRDPAASVPALLELREAASTLAPDPLVDEKRRLLDRILQACLGLAVETSVPGSEFVPGEALAMHHTASVGSAVPVRWVAVRYPGIGADAAVAVDLRPGETASLDETRILPEGTPVSQPYWLREEGTPGMFRVDDPRLIGNPENPPAVPVEDVFEVGGQTLVVADEAVRLTPGPAGGVIRRRLDVIPPVSLSFAASVEIFAPGAARSVEVDVVSARSGASGSVSLEPPEGWSVAPGRREFRLGAPGASARLTFTVTAPKATGTGTIAARADLGGAHYGSGRHEINYGHIPPLLLQPPARLRVSSVDLAIRGRRVGYLPGAGDSVDACLGEMGYAVTQLSAADLTPEGLRGLDAVVVGVRAFNTRADLAPRVAALLAYVEAGGTLVEQYNTPNGLQAAPLGPYPLKLSRDLMRYRVTDENAPVTLLAPADPAFTGPNRIGPADFDGWVQERGLDFPSEWDTANYTPLLACGDAGEPPLTSGLLVAHYGRGVFVYTGLSFFRQLPAGVPGAYRLFANLVSLGK
jgi:LmbE family N-acetylglucosaminyl deacetylase